LIIRQEKPKDFVDIYDLVLIAFQTAKVSNGKEQDFVNQLRVSGGYIPELALVAEEDDKIVGHIMLTKTFIATTGGLRFEALLLAPLSVVQEYRKRGVGSELVNYSFQLAKNMGYKAVFVVGDPAYYVRFGFKSSALYGIRHVPEIPSEYVMAYEFSAGALTGITGSVSLG
jgi:predicted N-acetyltransferase YhbS